MTMRVDPRAWNLLAGLSLAVGACGGRIISSDDGDGSSGDGSSSDATNESDSTSTSTSTTDESESGDPECIQDSDCPPGYYCLLGVCHYQIAPDGSNGYDCYTPYDCGSLAVCFSYSCIPVPEFSGCRPTAESGIPLTIGETALALSFVDLDADGAAELVAATQTELHAFESGSNVASVSARVYESPSVAAMVAGDFEPDPGQDLMLLVDDALLNHPSDGIAGFDPPSMSESPQLDSTGMLAGEFDGAAPTDLLIWGDYGASVITSDVWALHDAPIEVAAAHDLSSGNGRFVLRDPFTTYFYSLDAELLASAPSYGGVAAFVVAIGNDPDHFDLNATVYTGGSETWTLFDRWYLDSQPSQWGVPGSISAMLSGDLDGNGRDEVVLIHDGGVTLIENIATWSTCIAALDLGGLTGATHLAIGDHDGDGDNELAVAFAGGEILVFDGEG